MYLGAWCPFLFRSLATLLIILVVQGVNAHISSTNVDGHLQIRQIYSRGTGRNSKGTASSRSSTFLSSTNGRRLAKASNARSSSKRISKPLHCAWTGPPPGYLYAGKVMTSSHTGGRTKQPSYILWTTEGMSVTASTLQVSPTTSTTSDHAMYSAGCRRSTPFHLHKSSVKNQIRPAKSSQPDS